LPYSEQVDPYGRLLRCRVAHLDGSVELHLTGELDMANADALRERVMWLAGLSRGDVTLDLRDLEFMGSVGLRCLLELQEAMDAEQRRLVLRNVPPPVSRVIEVTRTEELLNIE
jgi:anti-anti-sigma factor